MASLKVLLNQKIIHEVEKKGQLFRKKLKHKKIKNIDGVGLLLAVEMESADEVAKFIENAADLGLITDAFLFAPNKFRIGPPLVITEEQIDEVCAKIIDILDK